MMMEMMVMREHDTSGPVHAHGGLAIFHWVPRPTDTLTMMLMTLSSSARSGSN